MTSAEFPADHKWVYDFGEKTFEGPMDRNLLGGKGRGLAEMTSKGLPIPPGFIVTTETCVYFFQNKGKVPVSLQSQIDKSLALLEKRMDAKFGDVKNPLLVSVRSGARVSMPGMMETILDLGLNDETVKGFAAKMKNERLAWDSYRRFIAMYSNVVDNVNGSYFEQTIKEKRRQQHVDFDIDLSVQSLCELCDEYKQIYRNATGKDFPQDPREQLDSAVKGVFRSWECDKAIAYRRFHGYPDEWGTAVIIMSMVFGNRGEDSATGVGFTRDPSTGDRHFYGEYLPNAQGEDVVAGIRTPQPVNRFQAALTGSTLESLEQRMPECYKQLETIAEILETHFQDMQDVEFTIDAGRLFMLQTRSGKRTGFAAFKIACDMLREELITEDEALMRIEPEHMTQLMTPVFEVRDKVKAADKLACRGLNAGPGAAAGVAVFSSEKAAEWQKQGKKCILVREETSPEDFPGMVASEGILTMRGGATSHAAVVARGLGKPCVCGCSDLVFDEKEGAVFVGPLRKKVLREGDPISIDGTTGQVFFTILQTRPSEIVQILIEKTKKAEDSELFQQFDTLMKIADKHRRMKVYTNADTPHDAAVAKAFGAQGIGLVRTEHMFMAPERLLDVRVMLFSEDEEARKVAVKKLEKYQMEDFVGIFRVMDGAPVTVRLLDPPRHEFLPHSDAENAHLAKHMGITMEKLSEIRHAITEANPMMGHRGCRLGIIYPYLTEMQCRAIFRAAVQVSKEIGKQIKPEIMIPLVSDQRELHHQKLCVEKVAAEIRRETGLELAYSFGSMIELPRAALVADTLAKDAEFFSFGTNDLTQCTFGMSRDDAGAFLPLYVQGVDTADGGRMQILRFEPFQTLDQSGVGELIKMAVSRGKETRRDIKCGICGEHGGDGKSVKFCHTLGLDYVSCSPFRVCVARIAAGQAARAESLEREKVLAGLKQ
uniref:Pyruvate, phosphate dikinase n=1 Tax=Chromera velia CCMP2878 TaxID=1169474 RepID=A0A0G4ICQ4_9ALVE|mmetsp:Transcript_525/g.1157  ORF Transcript_525/g.1157 Transcript_525/m.1157 type:complete len:939 (-) Transcript_525:1994-4810(-)|eukprot:Cvel_13097.t1-p1 / transcript=Cvel_13097.t1 / gene=Cvel_13097 / organism=Chromera_velia_CCMP2878 / gene_product=Pyruvate, phosphate dikinase, putative / transcript_product=Pyruvate, phosphate dikinase, putative / location=Cvel_scaffold882:35724-42215(+) / protein_length=938 / sequence_SO=supercontig / SO=protein_coding / is_pseudo=false